MLVSIISYYEHHKQYQQAVEFRECYLVIEPAIEELYQRLMRYYAALGTVSMCEPSTNRLAARPAAPQSAQISRRIGVDRHSEGFHVASQAACELRAPGL